MGNTFVERIICLANSRRMSGRCIAGKRVSDLSWCRPISNRPHHEISEDDRKYEDGSTAELLDIIAIPCVRRCPDGHQIENVLIDDRFYWQKKGRAHRWKDIIMLVDEKADLWVSGYRSYYNKNNRVPEERIEPRNGSLRLVALDEIVLCVEPKAPDFEDFRKTLRAEFRYQGIEYRLDVTDPHWERFCFSKQQLEYKLSPAIVCVSLTPLHTNRNGETFAYKLVATIFTKERVEKNICR